MLFRRLVRSLSPSSLADLGQRCKAAVLGVALVASLGVAAPRPAQALTLMLNFVPTFTTDIFNVTTQNETFASWGFTGLSTPGSIYSAALAGVIDDFLGYPTLGTNALSPLPVGKELNIDFEFSTGLTAPTNGDSAYYFFNIGDGNPNEAFYGQACFGCVRGDPTPATNGSMVGSILSDSIFSLISLAANDAQRMNLLVGTISHEIGHTLNLDHPSGPLPNPGMSNYSLMATGASPTGMPNNQRILDRDFAYDEFGILMRTVGLRDIEITQIPEPASIVLLGLGLLAIAATRKRRLA